MLFVPGTRVDPRRCLRDVTAFRSAADTNPPRLLRNRCGAGDALTDFAEIDFADLMRELTPCSRLAERATVSFRIDDWQTGGK